MERPSDRPGRFELRVWDPDPDAVEALVDRGRPNGAETTEDRYLVGPDRTVNAKLRDGCLEVKRLTGTSGRLERWRPDWSTTLPIDRRAARRLLAELGLRHGSTGMRIGARPPLSEPQVSELVASYSHGRVGIVRKRRRHYLLDGVRAEVTDMAAAGDLLRCVVLEACEPEKVRAMADSIGLDGPNRAVHQVVAELAAGLQDLR